MTLRNRILDLCNFIVYWGIVLIPPAAAVHPTTSLGLMAVVGTAFLTKKTVNGDASIPATPANLPLLCLSIIAFLSLLNTPYLRSGLQGMVKLLVYGSLVLIVASELNGRRHLKRIVLSIICGLFLASADGFSSLIFGRDLFSGAAYQSTIGLPRIRAAFAHTNLFAGYLTLFLALPVSLALYHLKGKRRLLLTLVSVFLLLALINTYSRSAIFGAWVAILFMAICKKDKILMLLLAGSLLLVPLLVPPNIRQWANRNHSLEKILFDRDRLEIYRGTLNMIRHHPVIGVGINTFRLEFPGYKVHETKPYSVKGDWYAHNIFLHTAGEIGLTGMLVFLWLLFRIFRYWALGDRHGSGDAFTGTCSLGIQAGILAFLVNGITESNLYYTQIAHFFWFAMGLSIGVIGQSRKTAESI